MLNAAILLVLYCLLPTWAAETVAFRRPASKRLAWRLAGASVAAAVLLWVAWRGGQGGPRSGRWLGGLETASWLVLLGGNVALIAWGYAGRQPADPQGFPVLPAAPKHLPKSDSADGPTPGAPI